MSFGGVASRTGKISNPRTWLAYSRFALSKENDRFFSTAPGFIRAAPFWRENNVKKAAPENAAPPTMKTKTCFHSVI
jgi:hypothetical protein